jgi:hypothetical protein
LFSCVCVVRQSPVNRPCNLWPIYPSRQISQL